MATKKTTAKATKATKKVEAVEAAVETVVEAAETKKATRKPAVKSSLYVQFGGKEILEKDVVAACKKLYAELVTDEDLKTLEIYLNVEESAAYFVANGVASEEYKVAL